MVEGYTHWRKSCKSNEIHNLVSQVNFAAMSKPCACFHAYCSCLAAGMPGTTTVHVGSFNLPGDGTHAADLNQVRQKNMTSSTIISAMRLRNLQHVQQVQLWNESKGCICLSSLGRDQLIIWTDILSGDVVPSVRLCCLLSFTE